MKSSGYINFLLIMAMGLTLLPAPLEAACGMLAHPDLDPMGAPSSEINEGSDADEGPGHHGDDCCETGCHHCSLPCCSGTAMIPTAAQMLDGPLHSDGSLAASTTDAPWVDGDPLYHPPRD